MVLYGLAKVSRGVHWPFEHPKNLLMVLKTCKPFAILKMFKVNFVVVVVVT